MKIKYRIISYGGMYRIQWSIGPLWFTAVSIAEFPFEYETVEDAERVVEAWIEQEKNDGKVMKEF